MFLNALAASAVACFTSNAELRNATVLYANGSITASSNLSLTYGYPISEWCVDQVADLSAVFANLTAFNEPLTNWNTSGATTYVRFAVVCKRDRPSVRLACSQMSPVPSSLARSAA
jgi:Mycoplasma protein of unknown function, DUF285